MAPERRTASPGGSSSSSAIPPTRARRRSSPWAASASSSARRCACRWCSTASSCGATSTSGCARRRTRPGRGSAQRGYLFLADDATSAALAARADAQDAAGAVQRRLGVDEIAALVPGLMLDDIRWGLFGPDDGYANPREVLFGLRAAAAEAGAEFVTDEVIGVAVAAGRVDGVVLARAGQVSAPVVVNAAGALAGRIAAMAGLAVAGRAGAPAALPVHPAAPLADALSDGRRSGRRPLAARRSGGRRRARSHHPRLHEDGTNPPVRTSTATTPDGSTSSIRRWCAACRRWPTSRTCTAGPGSTR